MPKITEQFLKKNINSKIFSKLYFLYGEEKYLIIHYKNTLIQNLLGNNICEFNYQSFNVQTQIDDLISFAEALPLMSEKKCVVINDFDIQQISPENIEKLTDFIKDIPDSTVIIISQTSLEHDSKKKNIQLEQFINTVSKYGDVIKLDKKNIEALITQLISWASKRCCTLDKTNAYKIIETCGTDLLTLTKELEKLCSYVGSGEITEKDIDIVTTKNLSATIFTMINALTKGDYDKVYNELNILFYNKIEPIIILSVLANVFVDMYRVAIALKYNKEPYEIKNYFDYNNKEFRIRNAIYDSKIYSINDLNDIINIIMQADINLKSEKGNRKLYLEKLIAQIIVITKKCNESVLK